jgi:hypothetical protein
VDNGLISQMSVMIRRFDNYPCAKSCHLLVVPDLPVWLYINRKAEIVGRRAVAKRRNSELLDRHGLQRFRAEFRAHALGKADNSPAPALSPARCNW